MVFSRFTSLLLIFSLSLSLATPTFAGESVADQSNSDVPAQTVTKPKRGCLGMIARLGLWGAGLGAVALGTYFGVENYYREPVAQQTAGFQSRHVGEDDLSVAVIGDSLSSSMGYTGSYTQVWNSRTKRPGWPMRTPTSAKDEVTLFDLLSQDGTDVLVTNYARGGAYVNPSANQSSALKKTVFLAQDMSDQVDALLAAEGPFPNLVILFIGHNNVDWHYDIITFGLDEKDYIQKLPGMTGDSYEDQLRRIVDKAEKQPYPVTIMVYGLINFESVFIARDQALELRKGDPTLYPAADAIKTSFPSLLKEFQSQTIITGNEINAEIKKRVAKVAAGLQADKVDVLYSDAQSTGDFSALENLGELDALHPSSVGRTRIAKIMAEDVQKRQVLQRLKK